ncbi:MAG: D-glycerate dehydrogenase [Alphaproteobacteria bacterium]|nr:D-glycerate dehydrogenase [Alphaproteobacteria bacterium]HPF45504.1 D-glycerate dehydrogenase [Emcibacteraceae bacterium]
MKPVVIITRKLPQEIEARMSELFDAKLNHDDHIFSREELISAVKVADILVPTVTDQIDREILTNAGPDLKLIANFGVGVDHIDINAARNKMITVTNTPGVLTEDTADMAMALLLDITRRLSEGERLLRAGKWKIWSPTGMLGMRLSGKKLGIIGMGRIGEALAIRARAFGLEIHYHNRKQAHPEIERKLEATYWNSLDQMITRMDILSLNCPATAETRHLISARRIGLMPKHAYLINTARGNVVDEIALIEALEQKKIAGAGLDVYENEPNVNPRLFGLENVVTAPHMGSATEEARMAMGQKVLINIKTFVDGHSPKDRVLPEGF